MGGGHYSVIGTNEIEDWYIDAGQILYQRRRGHEADAGRDIFRAGALQIEAYLLHRRRCAVILPGTPLVEHAFDRTPAELFLSRDPTAKELSEEKRADTWHPK